MCKSIKLYFVCLMALILSGCGGGGTSSDPLGTDSITASASVTSLGAGQSSLITATVMNATGNPVTGRSVSFAFQTNNSGGTLSVLNNETKGNGQAMVSYTAGANSPVDSVQDTIQVSLSNDAAAAVVITRTAGTPWSSNVSLSADPTSLTAGQVSIIKANISGVIWWDGSTSSESVTFTIPINNSGGGFIDANGNSVSSITSKVENLGDVSVIYKAGSASPGTMVQDTVQAVLLTGATSAITITRSAGAVGYVVTVTPTPSTLMTRTGVSVITANVKDNLGTAYIGASVAFTVTSAGGVGAATVTTPATTNGNGDAISNYSSTHTAATSDIITASTTIGGVTYTGAAIVTVP
jgi:hypothetical protein